MAHLVETMAYAGEVPWHGLGRQVEADMSPEEMLEAAELNWTVSKRPLYTINKPNVWNIIDPTGEASFLPVENQHVVMRDSDNTVLSVAGNDYTPFQNHDVMGFFKKFTEAGSMTMETAGSLRDGKDIWGLAKLKSKTILVGDDEINGYLLLNNSHEVGKAMTMMFTPIRVVCNNTLTLALQQGGTRFRVLHVQMFDEEIVAAAENALGLSSNAMTEFSEQAEFLSTKRATESQLDNYVAELFQPKTLIERSKSSNDNLPALRDEFKRTALSVREAIENSPGSGMVSAKGTWWGALNGVTFVTDHLKKSRTEGNSLHSAWFGSGANVKRRALDKAIEYAKAA